MDKLVLPITCLADVFRYKMSTRVDIEAKKIEKIRQDYETEKQKLESQ